MVPIREKRLSATFLALVLTLCLAIFTVVGCGGGGGGGGGEDEPTIDLSQGYAYGSFDFDAVASYETYTEVGRIDFMDDGSAKTSQLAVSDGETLETFTYSYAFDNEAGILTLEGQDEPYSFVGRVSLNSQTFFVLDLDIAPAYLGEEFGVAMAFGVVESDDGLTLASLQDEYVICWLKGVDAVDKVYAGVSLVKFNGSGGIESIDGEALGDIYSVDADGTLQIDNSETFQGMVAPNGKVFFVSRVDSDSKVLAIGVKQSSNMSNASLSGNFEVAVLGFEGEGVNEPYTSLNLFQANGAGNWTGEEIAISQDRELENYAGYYLVQADGRISFTPFEQSGVLADDGNMFVLAGNDAFGDPELIIGLKTP